MKTMGKLGTLAIALSLASTACSVDEVPDGLKRTPACDREAGTCGATVKWDLYHKPLPDIPFPNDQAMWPDPTSRTGMRVNASTVAPTSFETTIRRKFDQLEGFGTTAPITVSFEKPEGGKPGDAAIDLANVIKHHQGDDYELADDLIYVVNLKTGVPAVLDLGEGSFQFVIRDKGKYWRNDTRKSEQNLLWETADETIDPDTGKQRPGSVVNGVPVYKPEWDTDFDGILDRPNLLDQNNGCPSQVAVALGTVDDADRDACITDKLLTFYERETDTLIARPLVPLEEKTQYAVVVTDRLLDSRGNPVRSPFDFVYHPSQESSIARLKAHLSNPDLKEYFGDIGGTGLEHVAFAWTFTTEPVTEDLRVIRDGLYGKGPLASLSKSFPQEMQLSRAAGLVDEEALAEGAEEPTNWETRAECKDKVANYHIVKFDKIKGVLNELVNQGFGFEGPPLDALLNSFDAVDHIAIGEFESPFLIEGGPKGVDPQASFDMDFQTGKGKVYRDKVQFLIAVPKETPEHKQPFPVAYYGHGYTSSSLEALGFAGHLAAQGIASVGMNATFHGLELGGTELQLARNLFKTACEAPFASALLSGRARDLDGDGTPDSGGDYWTPYMFHTRDVVRQSAVDLLQMFRVFKGFDGKRLAPQSVDKKTGRLLQDYNNDGVANDLAGDFDGDGTPDIGGPDVEFYAWGQSLGGFTSPPLAALDPQVVAAAPTAGATLMDVGVRTFQGGVYESIYLRMLGPLLVGGPMGKDPVEVTKASSTCSDDQISLRFAVVDVNDDREVEFGCLDKSALSKEGGTLLVTNGKNGEVRCGRIDKDGRFRVGIPASLGDRLEVQIYDQPDVVDSYDGETGCNITVDESHRVALINSWGDGLIKNGAPDPVTGEIACETEGGCTKFQNKYFGKGTPLRAIAEGIGYIRQTPSLRRLIAFATTIVDPADSINYMPLFGLHPTTDPDGNPMPPTALLNTVTIGDMNVPLSAGIAMGRAAGAVPFLRPDAVDRYPALADYVTPAPLYSALGGKTPNRTLIDHHVLEGINRLKREAPADLTSCHANEVPVTTEDVVCHPNCSDTDISSCLSHQVCENGRCVGDPVSAGDCAQYLYDIDVLDEGRSLYGENEASVPLRVARLAMPADADNVDAVWEPRLTGKPYSPDQTAWKADRRIVGQLMAYIEPKGVHGFDTANPCQNWDSGQYMINLFGRFFKSSGADVYYLSHPSSHQCLGKQYGKGSCSFYVIPK